LNGDALVSGHMSRLWSLHQDILLRWGVYTMFTYEGYSVPEGRRARLNWLVPFVMEKDDIIAYLKQELADIRTESIGQIPGTDISYGAYPFSGVRPYIPRAELEKVSGELLQRILKEHHEATESTIELDNDPT